MNEPFDSIDALLTKAIWVLIAVAAGMFIASALLFFGRFF
jgi:hypothetical protein